MNNGTDFATGKDVYFRVNGERVATVESYDIDKNKNLKAHGSMGESEAVGFSRGMQEYRIQITRAYMDDGPMASQWSFFDIEDFELVIVKPGLTEIYSPCRVNTEKEKASIDERIMQDVEIIALRRRTEK